MDKFEEALENLRKLRKSANTFCQHQPEQCELNKKYADTIEQAILELKAIREAKPSEAIECLERVDNHVDKDYDYCQRGDYNKDYNTIKQTLLKAQEQEKLLKTGELSDGYHTFNQLYYQRCILFASLVRLNKEKSWKSFKHSDGKYCFDSNGEWFIVGIDTPIGSYTYHYEKKYWDLFECQELECGKEWDGHTEEDVTRLLSLPNEQEKENAECVGGRSFNKEVIYLKQSIERCNDKPIFYFSKRYGNKYIVPQEEYEKLNNENAKLQNKCQEQEKVLEIINKKSVYIHLLQQCGDVESYNNYFITKYGLDEFTERLLLTQEEFDLLKR